MPVPKPSRRQRAWLYRVLLAAMPLLIAYGIIDDQHAALWVAFGGAVLGHGIAAANTPTGPDRNGSNRNGA